MAYTATVIYLNILSFFLPLSFCLRTITIKIEVQQSRVSTEVALDILVYFFQSIHEGVFLNQGKDSAVVHFICGLWSFRPFDAVELSSAFFLFKNVPGC